MKQAIRIYVLLTGLTGFITGLIVLFLSWGNGYEIFPLTAAIAGMITAWLCWKIIVGNRKQISGIRLFLTGLITGTFSHYVCWVITGFGYYICYKLTGRCLDSLGNPPSEFTGQLEGALYLSFYSLLFFGWLTLGAALISAFYCKKQLVEKG